jgi:hypothetical protein
MKVWVFFEDGYWDVGDVGWQSFESRDAAAQFIAERLAKAEKPDAAKYLVVEGRELSIRLVEYATRIDLE